MNHHELRGIKLLKYLKSKIVLQIFSGYTLNNKMFLTYKTPISIAELHHFYAAPGLGIQLT
jgi:hypothetical protein